MMHDDRETELTTIAQISEVVDMLNLFVDDEQRTQLLAYCEEVIRWNARVNVTGARCAAQFAAGPLFDALTLLTVLDETHRSFVDIGSGGGLPAIPMAILKPNIHITMVEPRQKRVRFLQHLVDGFQLNAEVLHTQDRELIQPAFDGASAQAVFPPKKWIQRARKILGENGRIYTLTSEPITPAMCPANVHIDVQLSFSRDGKERYAARLAKRV
ncbi:MAG: class I SAM-dependent methyltransferase [Deltaproteobacteria bacterium]|nr:class I SAM-dependent methyltransferase [Deltaproteobacteria bacterium]MBN2672523.1 class I SAM-dependent methyltransferase [Deltaproteobacteria bacterium]